MQASVPGPSTGNLAIPLVPSGSLFQIAQACRDANEQKPKVPEPLRKTSDGSGSAAASYRSTVSYHTTHKEERIRNMYREHEEKRRHVMLSVLPDEVEGISGWSKQGFKESATPGCPAGMEALIPLDRVFLELAGDEFETLFLEEIDIRYELFSKDMDRLYFVGETFQDFDSYPSRVREVNFTVTGIKGGMVFQMEGTTLDVVIKNDYGNFGSISKGGWLRKVRPCSPGPYIVSDKEGEVKFTLVPRPGSGYKHIEYEIVPAGSREGIGWIRRGWLEDMHGPQEFGVSFPKGLDPHSKTLLLASMVLLHFRINEPRNYGPNRRRFNWGLCFNLCVLLFVLGLMLVVILMSGPVDTSKADMEEAKKKNDSCPDEYGHHPITR